MINNVSDLGKKLLTHNNERNLTLNQFQSPRTKIATHRAYGGSSEEQSQHYSSARNSHKKENEI